MSRATYGDLMGEAARHMFAESARVQGRPFADTADALAALGEYDGLLGALERHVWTLITPGRIAGVTSSDQPEPSEVAALHLTDAIHALSRSPTGPPDIAPTRSTPGGWAHAARCVRAADDLIAIQRDQNGTRRSPDAHTLERPDARTGGLARIGDMTGALLACEDALALRAAQAGVSWARVRRWLPGMGALREHAHTLAAYARPGDVDHLDHIALLPGVLRTQEPLLELGDRLARVRQAAWELLDHPDCSIATLRDLTTAGVAIHAHAAAFHGADVTTPHTGPTANDDATRAMIDQARAWQRLHQHLLPFITAAPSSAVVREDLIAIGRLLQVVAPLTGTGAGAARRTDPQARRTGATLNGAVAVMADVGDWNARTFHHLATNKHLYLPAHAARGEDISDHPELAAAKLAGNPVRAPDHLTAAVSALYDAVREHPIVEMKPQDAVPARSVQSADIERSPIARPQVLR